MSNATEPAVDYEVLTDFSSDINARYRRAYPVGGTQFVFKTRKGNTVTVPAADYANFTRDPIYVDQILSTTDCDSVTVLS